MRLPGKLPKSDRRKIIDDFLKPLDRDPRLAPCRALLTGAPERQLALFAALERAALRGLPASHPPAVDDLADQLLCEILDAIERNPALRSYGSAYGPDRYEANLRALGAWTGRESAGELFTTLFSRLSAAQPTTYPLAALIFSPAAQESAGFGEKIALETCENAGNSQTGGGILHHADAAAGEQFPGPNADVASAAPPGEVASAVADALGKLEIPTRPLRRGRPPALDDVAKGRLLGLMSYGLSFRQAASQLGVHHVTLLNLLKRDEQFAQQVAEARLDAISQPLLTVVQASRTNWRAAAWLAKYLDARRISSYEQTPEEREVAKARE